MKKTNRHHVYPTSRLNGTGLVGICFESKKRKALYAELFEGEEDIIEAFRYLNEKFWGKTFEIEEVFKNKKRKTIEKVIISRKKKKKTNRPQISKVSKRKHELYHQIVGNMLPEESLCFFNHKFWNKTYELKEQKINGFAAPIKTFHLAKS